jgi:hypothetical protein
MAALAPAPTPVLQGMNEAGSPMAGVEDSVPPSAMEEDSLLD